MRKFILPVLAALVMGTSFTSCEKDEVIESMNTVWTEFTVTNDKWSVDPKADLRNVAVRVKTLNELMLR